MHRRVIIILLILALFLPIFAYNQVEEDKSSSPTELPQEVKVKKKAEPSLPPIAVAREGDDQVSGPPETLEGLKATGLKALKLLPETLKEIWQEFSGFSQRAWEWTKKIWNSYIYPSLYNIWLKVKTFLLKEIEERKPIIEEEFKKEFEETKLLLSPRYRSAKEELKTELPKAGKSLWERFKELIK